MSRSLADHIAEPAPFDSPVHGDVVEGCAGGSCGVVARFFLEVDDSGIIQSCAARVRGRDASLATASALIEESTGLTIVEAAKLGISSLHPSFQAMSSEDRERADVVEDAFHHGLGRVILSRMKNEKPFDGDSLNLYALVGMSGGVDSAVSLHRMLTKAQKIDKDLEVAGVTLRLWIDPKAPNPDAACCSPDSVRQARRTCHEAKMAHFSIDLRTSFSAAIVTSFLDAYSQGETPNPCVKCNGDFRLHELVAAADTLGADKVATGHYVRKVIRGDTQLIQRGIDQQKDQSYMLSTVPSDVVSRFEFPLGENIKTNTRAEATDLGLPQATTADSQEICFLGGGDYRPFLRRMRATGKPGKIVFRSLEHGRDFNIGVHDGTSGFTVGQRRGLDVKRPKDIPQTEPLYVIGLDAESGTVITGLADQLNQNEVKVVGLRIHSKEITKKPITAQIRYRMREGSVPVQVTGIDSSSCVVRFINPVRSPAPGQTIAIYDDEGVVLAAGKIEHFD